MISYDSKQIFYPVGSGWPVQKEIAAHPGYAKDYGQRFATTGFALEKFGLQRFCVAS